MTDQQCIAIMAVMLIITATTRPSEELCVMKAKRMFALASEAHDDLDHDVPPWHLGDPE